MQIAYGYKASMYQVLFNLSQKHINTQKLFFNKTNTFEWTKN